MNKLSNIGAIILAGGKATRMNGNKALLPVSGVKLIEKIADNLEPYFGEILISARSKEMFGFLPYPVAVDEKQGFGPIMGILSGLRKSRFDTNFVIACDIPELDIDFIGTMAAFIDAHDIVVPVSGENRFEPLFAFYNKRLIPLIEDLLSRGIRKINQLFPECRTKYIPFKNDGWYHNLNTLEDYQKYLEKT